MKLYDYLIAKREASETEDNERGIDFLEILTDAIRIEFKPETLPRYLNLLFMLYRIGYTNHCDRNRLKKYTMNNVVYIILRYKSEASEVTEIDEYSECTGETTVGHGFKELKVIISETREDIDVVSAEMIIENKDVDDLMFIERCIELSGLEYRITDGENGLKSWTENPEDPSGKISEPISIESDDLGFPEIKETVRWLKHKKVWKS